MTNANPITITIDPDPIHPGQSFVVCYKTESGQPLPARVKLDWAPDGVPDETVTLTADTPCVTRQCPATATGLIASDLTGNGVDVSAVVQP